MIGSGDEESGGASLLPSFFGYSPRLLLLLRLLLLSSGLLFPLSEFFLNSEEHYQHRRSRPVFQSKRYSITIQSALIRELNGCVCVGQAFDVAAAPVPDVVGSSSFKIAPNLIGTIAG